MIVIDNWPWIISTGPASGGNPRQELDLLSIEERSSWPESRVKAPRGLNRSTPACKIRSLDYARRDETIWGKCHPVNGFLYCYVAIVLAPRQNAAADKANARIFEKAP
jgi:hypothetical protein